MVPARDLTRAPIATALRFSIAFVLASCGIAPSDLPDEPDLVVVKAVRIPVRSWLPWYTRFADHCWVDVRRDGAWQRVEWNGHMDDTDPSEMSDEWAQSDSRWEREVRVLEWYEGPEARAIGEDVLRLATEFPHVDSYQAWPGPNSNTLVEWLARETPGMHVRLPTTAIGKNHASWARAWVTTSRTGIELETSILGAQVGLAEGFEAHLFGLPFGVGIWPPAIKVPFLPDVPFGLGRRGSVED